MAAQVERGREDNSCLAYWLCTTATLLHVLNTDINPSYAVERMIWTVLGSTLGGRSSATTSAGSLRSALAQGTNARWRRGYARRTAIWITGIVLITMGIKRWFIGVTMGIKRWFIGIPSCAGMNWNVRAAFQVFAAAAAPG